MKQQIAILYADSRFTPWKENVDTSTVQKVYQALNPKYAVDILHMVEPCMELADLLSEYHCVVNLCYGYKSMMQWEVASWLDSCNIPHLSSSGKVQKLAQNKLEVESLLGGYGLPVAKTLSSADEIASGWYIIKPVSGGCHRNISIVDEETLYKQFNSLNLDEWLIQPYLSGREFSVAVLPDPTGLTYETLYPVEIIPKPERDIFIAGQEYGTTERVFNPYLDSVLQEELSRIALAAHRYVGLEYMSRCDFRVHLDRVYLLDVNAMPNLHPVKSLFPQILRHQELNIKKLMERMLARHAFLQAGKGMISPDAQALMLLN